MRVLSLFSGVGGFDMGLEAAGMTTVFQCEIDKHARAVLDHHWPDVPKWDDVSTLTGAYILEQTGGVDIVAWGSPCQDLSLAGKRAGLSGERSGLFHEGIRIIKELRELSNGTYPTWSLWENVVGALSSNRGADFGKVLWEMDEAGACFSEWAVLDAQYFGVPQRRRRVFVASCFDSGTSERCGSPLFPVAESLPGHLAKGAASRKGTSGEVAEGVGAGGIGDVVGTIGPTFGSKNYSNIQEVSQGSLVVERLAGSTGGLDISNPLLSNNAGGSRTTDLDGGAFVVEQTTYAKSRRAQSTEDAETWVESDVTLTLNVFDVGDTRATTAIVEPVPIQDGREMEKRQNGMGVGEPGDPSYTLDQTGAQSVAYSIREDAQAGNFSATEVETARALQALQPSVQSHHAQTFITQPLMVDGRRVDDVRVYTEPVQTLQERMGTGGNNVPVVAQEPFAAGFKPGSSADAHSIGYEEQIAPSLEGGGGGNNRPAIIQEPLSFDTQFGSNANVFENQAPTLKSSQQSPSVTQAISYDGYNQTVEEEIHRSWRIGRDSSDFVADLREPTLVVRRLTPLECERLMGWPDNHTAIGTNGAVSDTNRYKMCGNGVASPVAAWLGKHLMATRSRSFMDHYLDTLEWERAQENAGTTS